LTTLKAESGNAFTPVGLHRILSCLGAIGERITVFDVEAACHALMQDGHVEAVWRKGVQHYRIQRTRAAPDTSSTEPETPSAA